MLEARALLGEIALLEKELEKTKVVTKEEQAITYTNILDGGTF